MVLEELIADAAADYTASQRQRTVVYSVDQDGYWAQIGSRPIRPLSTVVLPEGQVSKIRHQASGQHHTITRSSPQLLCS